LLCAVTFPNFTIIILESTFMVILLLVIHD